MPTATTLHLVRRALSLDYGDEPPEIIEATRAGRGPARAIPRPAWGKARETAPSGARAARWPRPAILKVYSSLRGPGGDDCIRKQT